MSLPVALTSVVVLAPEMPVDRASPLTTPELIGHVLDALIDPARLPLPVMSDAIKTVTGIPAWHLPVAGAFDTVRSLLAHVR